MAICIICKILPSEWHDVSQIIQTIFQAAKEWKGEDQRLLKVMQTES